MTQRRFQNGNILARTSHAVSARNHCRIRLSYIMGKEVSHLGQMETNNHYAVHPQSSCDMSQKYQ